MNIVNAIKQSLLIFALMVVSAGHANARATLPLYTATEITEACQSALQKAQTQTRTLATSPSRNAKAILLGWNRLQIDLEDVIGPIYLYASAHTDKAARDAADACLLKYNEFNTDLYQNEKIYQRVKRATPRTGPEKMLQKDLREGFEDTGVALSPDKRTRIKILLQKEEALRQEFDRNVRDNKTVLTFNPQEMQGLPQSYLNKAKRDSEGNYLLSFDYPDYVPFMSNAENEAARKRYYLAFNSRGTPRNLELMTEVMQLRKEIATLHGLPSYAAFITRRKMVEKPQVVERFLQEVKNTVREAEIREVEELRAFKAQFLDKPLSDTVISRWDIAFYQEKLRKARYDIDQEALRKYFPTQASLDYAMLLSARLYGIVFKAATVPVWHEDVRYFDVFDAASSKLLGGIYLDLFPREGKYRHAAAFGVRGVSRLARRTPISVLVTNFNREGLTHDELETLLHEFGHVLHGVLSTADFNAHAGTNVVRDFVEAPSQMFEEWGRKPESLQLLQAVCPACPTLDEALIKRLDAARRYGKGMQYARQHLYASFDLAMTGSDPQDAMQTWKKMEIETPLGYVEGTAFPGSFTHIMGGYAAGYYGYMWSEVLALDMLSKFGDNLMNPNVGRRFRKTILANGGQIPAKDLVRQFLGRAPDNRAFFAEISGQR